MIASYDIMTSHFKILIKRTWQANLPFAILGAIVLYFLLPNKSLHDWGEANPWLSFILQTIIYLGTIVMFFVTIIPVRRWLKAETRTKDSAPSAKLSLGKRLLRILRHLGGYLMTCFLGGLMCFVLICVACLPAGIISTAQMYSQLGALDGDPLGTPIYFTPLLFIILIATCFVIIYLIHWLGITLAYQHGSYQVHDEEKQKLKENKELEIPANQNLV